MDQCQNKKNGQCPNRALTGKKYCNSCDILISTSTEGGRLRAYRLKKWQDRLQEFGDSSQIRNLTDEIGIARITLEAVLNSCEAETDLLANSHRVGDLVTRIEKLVTSCHRIEKSTGALLDKSSILRIAGDIIGIVQRHVPDATVVEKIATEIIDVISRTENLEE